MHIGARDLLRKLGAGVRPSGVRVGDRRDPFEARSFDALLDEVRRGGASGRAVGVRAGVMVDLSGEALAWLGDVGDAAESAGLARVVAFLSGRTVELDVAAREVVGGGDLGAGVIVTGAEAVAVMHEGEGEGTEGIEVRDAQDLHGTPDARGPGQAPLASLEALGRRAGLAADRRGRGKTDETSPASPGLQEK